MPLSTDFLNECVSRHNSIRDGHKNTAGLTKSDALCQSAQQWADHLLQKSEGFSSNLLVHSSDAERQGAGENLYYLSREETMTLDELKTWRAQIPDDMFNSQPLYQQYYDVKLEAAKPFSEVDNYNFVTASSHNGYPIGHFTQVVWRSSTEIGVGVATNGKGKYFVVAHYQPAGNVWPAGNYSGTYDENVSEQKPGFVFTE
ncbi:unnamed protein product [Clavelina lepadiformis]|uniref:SCP domain-containing protein n=1 Tax=Clavelina lepadiformis TaxID=159417 RepID=A0ABP0GA21_CLALP